VKSHAAVPEGKGFQYTKQHKTRGRGGKAFWGSVTKETQDGYSLYENARKEKGEMDWLEKNQK